MKKITALLLAIFIICLGGCEEKKTKNINADQNGEYILIVTKKASLSEQTAHYISASLSRLGYSSLIKYEEQADKMKRDILGVILVGNAEYPKKELPTVRCKTAPSNTTEKNTVSPCLSSKSLARAAVLLLPNAGHFTVISEAAGAADVQDACDLLDLCGVDYTVEALDGRAYGDAVISAAEKGCDGLILPSTVPGGLSIELSEYETAVVAVGEGEPVRGALASFCIDTEKLAEASAQLFVSLIEGKEIQPYTESYYKLCISKKLSERFCVDLTAVSEDFNAVVVE